MRYGKLSTPLMIQLLLILYQSLDNNGGWVLNSKIRPWETRGTNIKDIRNRIQKMAHYRGYVETKKLSPQKIYVRITRHGLGYLKYRGYINSDQLEEAKKKLEWNKMLSPPLE
ncbi:MAG: hypothetical protein JRD89_04825 [Deltaproteobacteria bacterium]|nr:hypothetical protein [Deltaproteobacteria bacterium]